MNQVDETGQQPSIAASIAAMRKPSIEKRIEKAINWLNGLPRGSFETQTKEGITKAVFKKLLSTGDRYVKCKMKDHFFYGDDCFAFTVKSSAKEEFTCFGINIKHNQEIYVTIDNNGFHFKTDLDEKPMWFFSELMAIEYFELIEV